MNPDHKTLAQRLQNPGKRFYIIPQHQHQGPLAVWDEGVIIDRTTNCEACLGGDLLAEGLPIADLMLVCFWLNHFDYLQRDSGFRLRPYGWTKEPDNTTKEVTP